MRTVRLLRPWTLMLLVALAAAAARAAPPGPQAVVEGLHDTLLEVMKNADALGYQGRHDRLAPVVRRSFDLAFISRIVLGRAWDELSETDRLRMIETFTRLTVATYASRFDGYSGQRFNTLARQDMKRGRVLVRTELERPDDEAVPLDYVLQESEAGWRIVNVVADGVSDLSLKRADYGSILKRDGFDALIGKLEGQITDMQGGA